MKQMTRRERITAAINREPVDRVPYAVWRHFPAVDHSPAGLAQATLRFHDHYGSDFLKITPHGGYAVEAWGCVEAEEVLPDGHRACAAHDLLAAVAGQEALRQPALGRHQGAPRPRARSAGGHHRDHRALRGC